MPHRKAINYKSCFDIIGPIMVGPSSSHTAGAIQIGLLARHLFGGDPLDVTCIYYESFAETHKGHGTDFAIVSGVLGFATDDERVPSAVDIAEEMGIAVEFIEQDIPSPVFHANTADLTLKDYEREVRIIGTSVGGGTVEVKYVEVAGFDISLTGPLPIIIAISQDEDLQEQIDRILADHQIELMSRREQEKDGSRAYVYELKSLITQPAQVALEALRKEGTIYILK